MNSISENDEKETIRLQVFLSHAGLCSRRGAEELIASGRVRVNEKTVRERGFRVAPNDRVTVDGQHVNPVSNKIYIVLNKPSGFVCSHDDPDGRALAKDLLGSYSDVRLFSVGRLDYLSEGLIFFTNDGEWSNTIAHPSARIEKEYEIETQKEIPDEFLEEFTRGIYVDRERYRIDSYKRKGPRSAILVLHEGKNREIRNACAARKITVKRLVRIRIGCIKIGNMTSGQYRVLGDHEVKWFYDAAIRKNRGRGH